MKWGKGYRSKDVIDARGGQMQLMGVEFTFNVEGTISSINGSRQPSRFVDRIG